MLADGHAKPPATSHVGRYQVLTADQMREMQGAIWDEEEARAFATAGTVALSPGGHAVRDAACPVSRLSWDKPPRCHRSP